MEFVGRPSRGWSEGNREALGRLSKLEYPLSLPTRRAGSGSPLQLPLKRRRCILEVDVVRRDAVREERGVVGERKVW